MINDSRSPILDSGCHFWGYIKACPLPTWEFGIFEGSLWADHTIYSFVFEARETPWLTVESARGVMKGRKWKPITFPFNVLVLWTEEEEIGRTSWSLSPRSGPPTRIIRTTSSPIHDLCLPTKEDGWIEEKVTFSSPPHHLTTSSTRLGLYLSENS